EVGLRRQRPVEQVDDVDRHALRVEPGQEPADPLRVAARYALAMARRQDRTPGAPVHGLEDPARELLLRLRRHDDAPSLVLDQGATVLRHAVAAGTLRIAV